MYDIMVIILTEIREVNHPVLSYIPSYYLLYHHNIISGKSKINN